MLLLYFYNIALLAARAPLLLTIARFLLDAAALGARGGGGRRRRTGHKIPLRSETFIFVGGGGGGEDVSVEKIPRTWLQEILNPPLRLWPWMI